MLTEETVIDRIDVDALRGSVLVRRATFVLRDGVRQPNPTYHRNGYDPGQDVSHEDPRVQAIAAVAWTDAVKASHVQALHELAAKITGQGTL